MHTTSFYNSLRWRVVAARAVSRDGGRCTVSRWLGGACTGPLHAHHIHAVAEGGPAFDIENVGTACAAHHPMWESLRRHLVKRMLTPPPKCTHWHPTRQARELCERRMARRVHVAA